MSEPLIQHYADKEIGEITGWWWPSMDVQTWGFIKQDWEQTHHSALLDIMSKYQKPMDTVIQAGGNCGMYPRLLSNMFKKVYTYEPDPINFTALTLNTFVPNIFKQNAAVGERGGFVQMVHRTFANVGMHQVVEQIDGVIPQVRIDDIPYKNVDLLWLDIEEYEIHALRGAQQTIINNQPIVMCENATHVVDQFMFDNFKYKKVATSHMDGIYYIDK